MKLDIMQRYFGGNENDSPLPINCWPGKVNYGKKNSPSGKKYADGSPKKVNDCGAPGRNDK
tara:strand:+ start:168 stop:350 length:183 start_codon:yes stop_codon:yes gene_type:complete